MRHDSAPPAETSAPWPGQELYRGRPPCDSCGHLSADLVLSWPDNRFRVCARCVSSEMARVAEPLDPDDPLATDPRPRAEREWD